MYPFSLRAMLVVQSVPYFSVRMKPTSCHKTLLGEDVLQPLTHAPARNETSPTHQHHARSDQSSCAPNTAGSPKPVVFSASSPTPDKATRSAVLQRFGFDKSPRATSNQRIRGMMFLAPPGHTSFSELCPLTPFARIRQARHPASQSQDVLIEFGGLCSQDRIHRGRPAFTAAAEAAC